MASQLLGLAGWWFLPNLVTSYAQPTLYAIFIRAGDPKPAPGSAKYNRHRKWIHTAVILLYLLYTIVDAESQLQLSGNFYRMLGVPLDAPDKALRSRWRRIAAQLHPDKAAGQDTSHLFTQLQSMSETLFSPSKRFAYDRFGPEILGWQSCTFTRDFVFQGLYQILAYYVGSAGILLVIAWAGYFQSGVFWRFFIMGAMFVFEVASATRPEFLGALRSVNSILGWMGVRREGYLPFQMVVLLRKVVFAFFIAINQLGPMFENPEAAVQSKGLTGQLQRTEDVTNAIGNEVGKILRLELVPFGLQQGDMDVLRKGLKGFLEDNTVRNDPEVQAAIVEALKRKRGAKEAAGTA